MRLPQYDEGSFRDPGGQVFADQNHIYRTINSSKAPIYKKCKEAGIYKWLEDRGYLVSLKERDLSEFSDLGEEVKYVVEHPKLPFISYPYEWSFNPHKKAALLHLDMHIDLLNKGFTLSDASAYNIQFQGTKPIFIDHLSIEPYNDGDIWTGHQQFCAQFLNPLLLWSLADIAPNSFFRGSLEGISPEETSKILPLSKKFSWTVFTHVVLQAKLQKNALNNSIAEGKAKKTTLSKMSFIGILTGMRNYIDKLKGPDTNTVWASYENNNTYTDDDASQKLAFIQNMVQDVKPALLFDIGCNTGNYSSASLDAGAANVIGFDFDHTTLDFAFERFGKEGKNFTPLWLDAANPSPSQGWAQKERKGLTQRSNADALIALAFIHHIVIGRNIPLSMALDWLLEVAPCGVIEFPSKNDPMVKRLLNLRQDIFPDYTEKTFLRLLSEKSNVVASKHLNGGTRLLVWYKNS
jgi:ribosomal protein L11 methylase PrmA|tara:strand:+ start:56348 stop:57739 length:1392 start_codon:yes stop_codon:yes gene_type:complete